MFAGLLLVSLLLRVVGLIAAGLIAAVAPGRGRRRGRSCRRRGGLEVVEQVNRVVAAAQLVVGERIAAIGGHRGRLDRDRIDLGVELDTKRQVVRQAAVERHAPALVHAEEVDLTHPEVGAVAQPGKDQEDREDLCARSPAAAARLRGVLRALASRRGGADAVCREAGVLGTRADQRRARIIRRDIGDALQAEGDDGDVVAAAGLVRLLDERPNQRVEVVRLGDQLGDARVLDHRRQAVGAEQEDVAGLGLPGEGVHLDRRLRTERARDDRALRVILGLLLGELALAAQLLDQRMVGGEQLQLVATP